MIIRSPRQAELPDNAKSGALHHAWPFLVRMEVQLKFSSMFKEDVFQLSEAEDAHAPGVVAEVLLWRSGNAVDHRLLVYIRLTRDRHKEGRLYTGWRRQRGGGEGRGRREGRKRRGRVLLSSIHNVHGHARTLPKRPEHCFISSPDIPPPGIPPLDISPSNIPAAGALPPTVCLLTPCIWVMIRRDAAPSHDLPVSASILWLIRLRLSSRWQAASSAMRCCSQ